VVRLVYGILAGVLITLIVLLFVAWVLFPGDLLELVIPMYLVSIVGWVYSYWVTRKKVR
jgi:hypothetical protein